MAKKKSSPKAGLDVISLDRERERRKVDGIVDSIRQLAKGMTDHIAEFVDLYHRWEEANPGKAVSRADKLEMLTLGFVGPVGYVRCHEEHRLPRIALYGMQAEPPSFGDFEQSEDGMCPALESGRCQTVLKLFKAPPCILLGGELQQLLAPERLSSIGEAVFDGGYRDSPAEERQRFARARALVKKHEKLEREAERGLRKKRKRARRSKA